MKIKIMTKHGILEGEINPERNPNTAEAIIKALPIKGKVKRWGNEIYFETPVILQEENSQQEVEVGDIAYWPPGRSICIFFGKTPISTTNKPKAYSPVNVFGKIETNLTILKNVKEGELITIEKV
jgi:hypothetical protein